jgi:hypothetical protein
MPRRDPMLPPGRVNVDLCSYGVSN